MSQYKFSVNKGFALIKLYLKEAKDGLNNIYNALEKTYALTVETINTCAKNKFISAIYNQEFKQIINSIDDTVHLKKVLNKEILDGSLDCEKNGNKLLYFTMYTKNEVKKIIDLCLPNSLTNSLFNHENLSVNSIKEATHSQKIIKEAMNKIIKSIIKVKQQITEADEYVIAVYNDNQVLNSETEVSGSYKIDILDLLNN